MKHYKPKMNSMLYIRIETTLKEELEEVARHLNMPASLVARQILTNNIVNIYHALKINPEAIISLEIIPSLKIRTD